MKGGKINREWHESHIMPGNPTREQRVEWHAGHAEACGCRDVPVSLVADVKAFRKKTAGRSN